MRPVGALVKAYGGSMPSGHATIATIFCFLIVFSYKDHISNRFLKVIFISLFSIIALAVSLSRIYLSVHYFSDVLIGIILGLFISAISVLIFKGFEN